MENFQSSQTPILSVTEISLSLKSCVEQVFGHIRVRGEVVGVKRAPSGHTYFSLKDTDSVLSAVCWRGRDKTTLNALQDGLEIICTGKLSTYPGRSNYQMIVDQAEPAGIGALLKLLNDRKIKLEKEGLFDPSRKKPIPVLPNVIGVVTSPSGAVIRDIMHRLNDRFPRHVLLWPVLVQGEGAADQIAAAITGFNAIPTEGLQTPSGFIPRPDLLIVARGGGSFEDLFCFNEENVVRAAAASDIPLISAVGHETDTTLIDYAADLRAPTPTGAAEKAVPVRAEIVLALQHTQKRLTDGLLRLLKDNELKLQSLSRGMPKLSDVVNTFFERLDDRSERLKNSIQNYIKNIENQTVNLSKLLKSYSYNAVLERGFSLVTDNDGHILSSAGVCAQQPQFKISFFDGALQAKPIPNSLETPFREEINFSKEEQCNYNTTTFTALETENIPSATKDVSVSTETGETEDFVTVGAVLADDSMEAENLTKVTETSVMPEELQRNYTIQKSSTRLSSQQSLKTTQSLKKNQSKQNFSEQLDLFLSFK